MVTSVKPRMTSTTVYLTDEQLIRLDVVGRRLKVPKAALVREGIDLALARHGAPATPEGQRETEVFDVGGE
jgi:hypothetical protein